MKEQSMTRTKLWRLFKTSIGDLVETNPNTFCLYDPQKKNVRYTIVYIPKYQVCCVHPVEDYDTYVLPPTFESISFTKKLKKVFNIK